MFALILLLVSTLVAFSAMRGSATQERMTFNHDARTDAYFGAEFGAAAFKQALDQFLEDNGEWPDAAAQAELQNAFGAGFQPYSRIRNGQVDHGFFQLANFVWDDVVDNSTDPPSTLPRVSLESIGQRQVAGIPEGEAKVRVNLVGAEGGRVSPFDGLLACDRIYSSSAGNNNTNRMMAESFDSSEDFGGTNRRGDVRIATTELGSTIEIKANATYRGSVASGGLVVMGSGATIDGDVEAFDRVALSASYEPTSDAITLQTGTPTTINGNVRAGNDLFFGGNRINESVIDGNVEVGGFMTQSLNFLNGNGRITGSARVGADLSDGSPPPTPPGVGGTLTDKLGRDQALTSPLRIPDDCDPLGIDNIVEGVDKAPIPRLKTVNLGMNSTLTLGADSATLANNSFVGGGGPPGFGKQDDGTFLAERIQFQGREVSAYSFESLSQGSGSTFRVESGDVLVYVPEPPAGYDPILFNNQGDAAIEIAEGASLTVVTGGRARLGGNPGNSNDPNWENNPLDIKGDSFFIERGGEAVPRFSLYSNANPGFDGTDTAVFLHAGDPNDLAGMHGLVYAPKGEVSVVGDGGWVGAITGRQVDIANKAEFLYDEVFGGGSETSLIASRIRLWQEEVNAN